MLTLQNDARAREVNEFFFNIISFSVHHSYAGQNRTYFERGQLRSNLNVHYNLSRSILMSKSVE